MRKFYLGMETIRITQGYNDGNHHDHAYGNPADYPIDMAGADSGKSCFFAPTSMKVVAIKGVGTSATNTVWLVSTEKVKTPTFIDYVFMTLTHFDDNAMKWKVGDIIPAGDIITWEGTDYKVANHLHVCLGRGYSDNWVENDKGKWVIKGDNKKPEEVAYIYDGFSKTVDTKGINFEHTDDIEYEDSFLPPRGWYQEGDQDGNVAKIDDFLADKTLGDWFGTFTKFAVMGIQDKYHIEGGIDGNIGFHTINKLYELGLERSVKLPSRGWFTEGDHGTDVAKINNILANQIRGDYYGLMTKYSVMALQTVGKSNDVYDDNIDGCYGSKTDACAQYYGFKH